MNAATNAPITPCTKRYELQMCQIIEWSDSILLTWEEFEIALIAKNARYTDLRGSKIDTKAQVTRYREKYPDAVPYKCGNNQQFLGLRYGFEGHQYLSFS